MTWESNQDHQYYLVRLGFSLIPGDKCNNHRSYPILLLRKNYVWEKRMSTHSFGITILKALDSSHIHIENRGFNESLSSNKLDSA